MNPRGTTYHADLMELYENAGFQIPPEMEPIVQLQQRILECMCLDHQTYALLSLIERGAQLITP